MKHDGSSRTFTAGTKGLYYLDTRNVQGTVLANDANVESPDATDTVRENLSKFTERQIKTAQLAREFQNIAGLSTGALIRMIDSNTMRNLPFTREDVKNAIAIWGESVAHIQGKTTRA